MPTTCPFASSIDSANRAVIASLANATVTIDGATSPAVFDNGYSHGNVGELGMANTQAAITILSELVPEDYDGVEILVNDQAFLIADVQPDGLGVSRVYLQVAA